MNTLFLVIVIFLIVLAVFDLVVGEVTRDCPLSHNITPSVGVFYRIITALGMRVEVVKPVY